MITKTTRRTGPPIPVARQRGATSLFITLVLLLVVMLLGVTAAMLSGTQFRLAGNLQFENEAFNLAEGATAAAESWLSDGTNAQNAGFTTYATAETPHLYPIGGLTANPLTMSWSNSNSLAVGGDSSRRYLIQRIGADNALLGSTVATGGRSLSACQRADLFRVTARGASAKGTIRIIQTTYTIPSC